MGCFVSDDKYNLLCEIEKFLETHSTAELLEIVKYAIEKS